MHLRIVSSQALGWDEFLFCGIISFAAHSKYTFQKPNTPSKKQIHLPKNKYTFQIPNTPSKIPNTPTQIFSGRMTWTSFLGGNKFLSAVEAAPLPCQVSGRQCLVRCNCDPAPLFSDNIQRNFKSPQILVSTVESVPLPCLLVDSVFSVARSAAIVTPPLLSNT